MGSPGRNHHTLFRQYWGGSSCVALRENYHFDPLKHKLGRLKRKCTDMGKLMDVLTRYGDSDTTKDPSSDDDKSGKGKKNGSGKGQQQHTSAQHSN